MEILRSHPYKPLGEDDGSSIELLAINSQPDRFHQSLNGEIGHGEDSGEGPLHHRTPAIDNWPQKASLVKKNSWRRTSMVLNVAIALMPLAFILLSMVAFYFSGSEISDAGHRVQLATRLGPTVFPVMFAAIIGRSLKALASYQAERGVKLGKLEQMMGSLTIFGAIELQVLLRTFDLLGIGLIVLWALSPLGGQASLRLLDTGNQSSITTQTLKYLDSDTLSYWGLGEINQLGFLPNSLYLAALLTPLADQSKSMDTWGNTKIPIIETMEQASISDADGWFTMNLENATYSSLIGLPVAGIPTTGSSSFSVESHYMLSSCNVSTPPMTHMANGSFTVNITGGSDLEFLLLPGQQQYPTVKPRTVQFESNSFGADLNFIAQCTLTRSSVESNISCLKGSCEPTHVRRSRFDLRPSDYTPLSFYDSAPDTFFWEWPQSAGFLHPGYPGPTEYFLSDPTLAGFSTSVENLGGVLVGMSDDVFSERFSLLLNTYWQCSLTPWFQTGIFPSNLSLLNGTVPMDERWGTFNATTATVTNVKEIYICNKTWATILLVASSTLLVCGIFGAIVKDRTRGPQILGYVSTMTRDNPYINLPSGGCNLDGLERARLLKDRQVILRDVAPDHDVGHIALSDGISSDVGKLVYDRLYAGPR